MTGSIAEFSAVPADNSMSPPVGAPEGSTQLKALNDIQRNQNAAMRAFYNDPLWRDVRDGGPNATYTFDSASVFRINSTAAAPFYPVGKQLKIVAGGWTRRGFVSAVATSGSDTVVTCTLDGALSNVPFAVYSAAIELTSLPGVPALSAADQVIVTAPSGNMTTVTVAPSTFLGRKATGATTAMTAADAIAVLGLGNVENKSSSMIRGELTAGNVTGALGYTPVNQAGVTSAVATNSIAARDASGDLFARYFNSGAPNSENPSPQQIWVNNGSDGYLRKISYTSFISQLGLRTTANLTALSQLTNDPGFITGGGRAYPRRSNDGGDLNISAAVDGSAKAYFCGTNDGVNWSPVANSNISVGYATNAGNAGTLGGLSNGYFLRRDVGVWNTSLDGYNRFHFANGGATYLSGNGAMFFSTNNAASYPVSIDGTGTVAAPNFYYSSDERLKTDIKPLDGAAMLAAIRAAGGFSYVKNGAPELGVLAQRVRRAGLGDLVREGEGGFLGFSAGGSAGPIFAALGHIADRLDAAGL